MGGLAGMAGPGQERHSPPQPACRRGSRDKALWLSPQGSPGWGGGAGPRGPVSPRSSLWDLPPWTGDMRPWAVTGQLGRPLGLYLLTPHGHPLHQLPPHIIPQRRAETQASRHPKREAPPQPLSAAAPALPPLRQRPDTPRGPLCLSLGSRGQSGRQLLTAQHPPSQRLKTKSLSLRLATVGGPLCQP